MRTSLTGRPGLTGLTRALVLALALAACGGGDESADAAGGAAATREARALQTTGDTVAATDTCTGPPPTFSHAVLTGPWQGLLDSLAAHNVSFPASPTNADTATVPLCNGCTAVNATIRSTNLTPCLRATELRESHPHILGMLIVNDTFPAQRGWDTLFPGDTLLMFARVAAGPATLVYNQGGSGKPSPATAWMFWYCRDGHTGKTAQAQWRPRAGNDSTANAASTTTQTSEGGDYGWMSCASGCCQFYTPPPNPIIELELPEQASEKAEEKAGPKPGTQRPTWCPTA
jgi:hypothetical protein